MSGGAPTITAVRGKVLPLPGDDLDTDQIIASRFLTWTTFDGLEAHLFEDARRACAAAGAVHPLDTPTARSASILLVGRNFGCGSSREHAPQALRRFGIRAILGPSFGEIFAGNCVAVGIVCAQLGAAATARLAALQRLDPVVTLDVTTLEVEVAGEILPCAISEGRRRQFLDGSWDALAQLLEAAPLIEALARGLPAVGPQEARTSLPSCPAGLRRSGPAGGVAPTIPS